MEEEGDRNYASRRSSRRSASPPQTRKIERDASGGGDRDSSMVPDRRSRNNTFDETKRSEKKNDRRSDRFHDRGGEDHYSQQRRGKSRGEEDDSTWRSPLPKNNSDRGWGGAGGAERGGGGADGRRNYSKRYYSQSNGGDRGWGGKGGKWREIGRRSLDQRSHVNSAEQQQKHNSNGRKWGDGSSSSMRHLSTEREAEGGARDWIVPSSSTNRKWGENVTTQRGRDADMSKGGRLLDHLPKRDEESTREKRRISADEEDSDARERRVQRLKRRRRSAGLDSSDEEKTRDGRRDSPASLSASVAYQGKDSRRRSPSRSGKLRREATEEEEQKRNFRRMDEGDGTAFGRELSRAEDDDRWSERHRRVRRGSNGSESQAREIDSGRADRRAGRNGKHDPGQQSGSRIYRHEQRKVGNWRHKPSNGSDVDGEERDGRSIDSAKDELWVDESTRWRSHNVRRREGRDGKFRYDKDRSYSKSGRITSDRNDRIDGGGYERQRERRDQDELEKLPRMRDQRPVSRQIDQERDNERDSFRRRRSPSTSTSAMQTPPLQRDSTRERGWPNRARRDSSQDRREMGRRPGTQTPRKDRFRERGRNPENLPHLEGKEGSAQTYDKVGAESAPSSAMQAAMEAALGLSSEALQPEMFGGDGEDSTMMESQAAPPVPVLRARPDEIYEQVAQVGEGTYGQVFKAKGDRSGVIVALKKIRMESEKDGFPITAMREIKLLQSLRHENVVRLHEMLLSKNSVYMVFEYLQHDLNGILAQPSVQFTPANLKSLAQQLLLGLAYLHHHSILHRDLKGSNLLLSSEGTLKLADFGLARRYNKRAKGNVDYTNRVVTLWYRPPELLFGETCYNDAIDIWGAGCIFLELFTRRPAFQGNDEIHQVQVLFELLGPITMQNWPGVETLPWYDLVRPCIEGSSSSSHHDDQEGSSDKEGTKTSNSNPNLQSLFAEQLPSDALDVASALLCYDPARRLSAMEALRLDYFARNLPRPEKPQSILANVSGEWHEFESRQAKRTMTTINKPPLPSQQHLEDNNGESPFSSKVTAQESSSTPIGPGRTTNESMGPPETQSSKNDHRAALGDKWGIHA